MLRKKSNGYDYQSLTIDQIDEDENEQQISPVRPTLNHNSKSMEHSQHNGSKMNIRSVNANESNSSKSSTTSYKVSDSNKKVE